MDVSQIDLNAKKKKFDYGPLFLKGIGGGYTVNHLDLGCRYAGLLLGLSNTSGTLSGIISPTLTGVLLGDNPGKHEWQINFISMKKTNVSFQLTPPFFFKIVAAIINVFGFIIWIIFGSGKNQF